MRLSRIPTTVRSLLLGTVVAATVGCTSSTQTYDLKGMAPAEGADGTIAVRALESGNHKIDINFQHLTPPKRYDANLASYAIWLTPRDGRTRLIGILGYSGEEREGAFSTVTPFRQFEILVTAEDGDVPAYPGTTTIARKRVAAPTS